MDSIRTILEKRNRPRGRATSRTLNKEKLSSWRIAASGRDAKVQVRLPDTCVCPTLPGGEKLGYVYADLFGDGGSIPDDHRIFGEAFFCVCREARALNQKREFWVSHSNIPRAPERYGAWRFTDYETPLPGQRGAKKAVIDWCSGQGSDYMPWLLLHGPNGVGKTHLACAAGNALLGADIQVRYEYVPFLLDHLRQGYEDNSYHQRLDEIRTATVLILDDFGAGKVSEWAEGELLKVIHYRHEEGAPLLVTTNLNPEDFEPRIRDRIADRFTSKVVPMVWESHRRV